MDNNELEEKLLRHFGLNVHSYTDADGDIDYQDMIGEIMSSVGDNHPSVVLLVYSYKYVTFIEHAVFIPAIGNKWKGTQVV